MIVLQDGNSVVMQGQKILLGANLTLDEDASGLPRITASVTGSSHNHDDRYYTETELQSSLAAGTSGAATVHWNRLTNTPTTIPGLGLTDFFVSATRVTTDYNDAAFRKAGFYGMSNTNLNRPTDYGVMLVLPNPTDAGTQIVSAANSDAIYFRRWTSSGGTYAAWRQLVHDGNFTSFGVSDSQLTTNVALLGAANNTWTGEQRLSKQYIERNTAPGFFARNLASYATNTSAVTGALVITTNITSATTMFRAVVEGFMYNSPGGNLAVEVTSYSNSPTWTNKSLTNRGLMAVPVRLARNAANKVCIILGDETTNLGNYAKLHVSSAWTTYSGASLAELDGWTITAVTDLSTYTALSTIAEGALPSNSGNLPRSTIGSTSYDLWANSSRILDGSTGVFLDKANVSLDQVARDVSGTITAVPGLLEYTGSTDPLFGTGEYLYFGDAAKFAELHFDLSVLGVGYTAVWEYWNGTVWTALTVTDGTSNFTVDGWVNWTAPVDWALTTFNALSRYWVRVSSSTAVTTTATALSANISRYTGNFIDLRRNQFQKFTVNYKGDVQFTGRMFPGSSTALGTIQSARFIYDSGTRLGTNVGWTIDATADASLSSTAHGLQIGASTAANLIFDTEEIMARNNGAAATLFLNADGGLVSIGSGGLTAAGNIVLTGTSAAGTASTRWIGANGSTGFYYNVPTSASHAFGVNNVTQLALSSTSVAVTNALTVGTTLGVTGNATFSGTVSSGSFVVLTTGRALQNLTTGEFSGNVTASDFVLTGAAPGGGGSIQYLPLTGGSLDVGSSLTVPETLTAKNGAFTNRPTVLVAGVPTTVALTSDTASASHFHAWSDITSGVPDLARRDLTNTFALDQRFTTKALFTTLNGADVVARGTAWGQGFWLGANLDHGAAAADPLSQPVYVAAAGASSTGGVLLRMDPNSKVIRFYTAPASTGAGAAAVITERFKISEGYVDVLASALRMGTTEVLTVGRALQGIVSATVAGPVTIDGGGATAPRLHLVHRAVAADGIWLQSVGIANSPRLFFTDSTGSVGIYGSGNTLNFVTDSTPGTTTGTTRATLTSTQFSLGSGVGLVINGSTVLTSGATLQNVTFAAALNVAQTSAANTFSADQVISKLTPWLTITPPTTGTAFEMAGGISIGESGIRGSASMHFVYTGDGYGHLGMGIVSATTGIPTYNVMRMHYASRATQMYGAFTFDTTITGSVSGNSGTATKLAAPVNINGVAFDGSAAITVAAAAGTLTGTALPAAVVTSSLTSVGTIATGTWNATIISTAKGGTGVDNSTGRAANQVWAGPSTGTTGAAGYRSLVALDIPSLDWTKIGTGVPDFARRDLTNTFALAQTFSAAISGTSAGFSGNVTAVDFVLTGSVPGGGGSVNYLPLSGGSLDVGASLTVPETITAKNGAFTNRPTVLVAGVPTTVALTSDTASSTHFHAWSDITSGVPDFARRDLANTFALAQTFSAGLTGTLTGNASTATKLAAPVNINGVAFDGSAAITVAAAAGTLTGTALPAAVVTSSLTSVGTIATGTWNATAIAAAKGGTGLTAFVANRVFYAGTTTAMAQTAIYSAANNGFLRQNNSGAPAFARIDWSDVDNKPATATAHPTWTEIQSKPTTIYGAGFRLGASATTGVLDWSDITNTRPADGPTLLMGNATSGPGPAGYFHPFNFEYATAGGNGNVTQLAIPYGDDVTRGLWLRGRYNSAWGTWQKLALVSQTLANSGSQTLSGSLTISGAVSIGAAQGLYLDGGSNTYITEVSSDTIQFVRGGSEALRLDSNGGVFAGHVYTSRYYFGGIGTTKYLVDGGSYIHLLNGSNAYGMKVGNLTISGSYGDTPPTDGLHVSGATNALGGVWVNASTVRWGDNAFSNSGVAHQIEPMSLKLSRNYNVAGAPANYGTVLDIYGQAAHSHHQLHFGDSGQFHIRHAFYGSTAFSTWRRVLIEDASGNVTTSGRIVAGGTSTLHYFRGGDGTAGSQIFNIANYNDSAIGFYMRGNLSATFNYGLSVGDSNNGGLVVYGNGQFGGGGTDNASGNTLVLAATGYPSSYRHFIQTSHSATSSQNWVRFSINNGVSGDAEIFRIAPTGTATYGHSSVAGDIYINGAGMSGGSIVKGLVGQYNAAKWQGLFAMSSSYQLTDTTGDTLTGLYGLAWSYDNGNGYRALTGKTLGHGVGLVAAGGASATAGLCGYWGHLGLWINGPIYANNFILNSDRNLKQDLERITSALDKVDLLSGYTFAFKSAPEKRRAGVMAQDVLEVLPEAVTQTDVLGVEYDALVPLLIEAIKELRAEVRALRGR